MARSPIIEVLVVSDHTQDLLNILITNVPEVTAASAEKLANAMRASIKRTGHRVSIPGEAPGIDTQELLDSIQVVPMGNNELEASFGIQMHPKARDLEFGTRTIASRPFITPAFEKWRPTFTKEIFDVIYNFENNLITTESRAFLTEGFTASQSRKSLAKFAAKAARKTKFGKPLNVRGQLRTALQKVPGRVGKSVTRGLRRFLGIRQGAGLFGGDSLKTIAGKQTRLTDRYSKIYSKARAAQSRNSVSGLYGKARSNSRFKGPKFKISRLK